MTEKGDEILRRNKLKINQEKAMLTLQTEQLAVQTIFATPILEVCNYHEQLAKYQYRAALSRLNLKVEQFDQYYSEVRQRADHLYHTLLFRSLFIFQDLLTAAKFAKIELWNQQAGLANGFRTNLFASSNDPYKFNADQFNKAQQQVSETMKLPISKAEESRELINEHLQRLKKTEAEKMEAMFVGRVEDPYVARNKNGLEVNPSSIYNSFQSSLRIKAEKSDEALLRKYFNLHDEVLRFGQTIFENNLKTQRQATYLLKKYSDSHSHLTAQIAPPLRLESRRQHLDADHLSLGKQVRSQSRPALANKNLHVDFKQFNRVYNSQTVQEELVQFVENEEKGVLSSQTLSDHFSRQDKFEGFNQRKRLIFKEYYQHRDLEKRLREDSRFGYKESRQRQKEKVIVRRIYRANITSVPWTEISQSSAFLYFLQGRVQKENNIWELKPKYNEDDPSSQRLQKEKGAQDKNKIIQEDQENNLLFEKRRKQEEELRINSLKSLFRNRTYQKFLAISKIEVGPKRAQSEGQIERYGSSLRLPVWNNSYKEADKFFYYYFKQRFYRQNEWVKENGDNPIIYLDSKKVNMSSTLKVVSQLVGSVVKRVDSLPFFLIWSEDIIGFRINTSEGRRVGKFQCYSLAKDDNCKKLIYQLRRRVSVQISEEIYEGDQKTNEIQIVMRKVEAAHRIIYNMHRPIRKAEDSVKKGIQIAEEIVKGLLAEDS